MTAGNTSRARLRMRAPSSLLPSSLELSDSNVYEPYTRARLGTTAHFCQVVVLMRRHLSEMTITERRGVCLTEREREFFVDNLLVRIHFIIVMIRWTGLAPCLPHNLSYRLTTPHGIPPSLCLSHTHPASTAHPLHLWDGLVWDGIWVPRS